MGPGSTHLSLPQEVSGGAASVWNDQNPGRRILPFDAWICCRGERCCHPFWGFAYLQMYLEALLICG